MDNYNRFKTKVNFAKGKTNEIRLSWTEASNITTDVEALVASERELQRRVYELEQAVKSNEVGKILLSGEKF